MHRRGTLLTLAVSLALASLGQAQSPAWQAARDTFLKNAENLCGALGQIASAAALNRDKGTPANTLIQMARDHFAAQPDLKRYPDFAASLSHQTQEIILAVYQSPGLTPQAAQAMSSAKCIAIAQAQVSKMYEVPDKVPENGPAPRAKKKP